MFVDASERPLVRGSGKCVCGMHTAQEVRCERLSVSCECKRGGVVFNWSLVKWLVRLESSNVKVVGLKGLPVSLSVGFERDMGEVSLLVYALNAESANVELCEGASTVRGPCPFRVGLPQSASGRHHGAGTRGDSSS